MKNTIKNKEILFTQYWGQPILKFVSEKGPRFNLGIRSFPLTNEEFLELTPLSDITDDDAIECLKLQIAKEILERDFKISSFRRFKGTCPYIRFDYLTKNGSERNFSEVAFMNGGRDVNKHLTLGQIDYLRSKGYALPFRDLSVEKQVEYGWIKLKSYENDNS